LDFEHWLQRPVSDFNERHARELDGVLRLGGWGAGEDPASVNPPVPLGGRPDRLDDLA